MHCHHSPSEKPALLNTPIHAVPLIHIELICTLAKQTPESFMTQGKFVAKLREEMNDSQKSNTEKLIGYLNSAAPEWQGKVKRTYYDALAAKEKVVHRA